MNSTPPTTPDELEVQLSDIFYVFGRRGFTDKETVDDSVRKAMYQINQRINSLYIKRSVVKERVMGALPTKMTESEDAYDAGAYGYNSALIEFEQALTKALEDV